MEPLELGPSLSLPDRLRARLEAWAVGRYPREACGLLLGSRQEARVEVVEVREARNLERVAAHERYDLDPVAHLEAEDAARASGLQVVGIWHSHPDAPAAPSVLDRERAQPGWSYVILSVRGSAVVGLRSWRIAGSDFVEERVLG